MVMQSSLCSACVREFCLACGALRRRDAVRAEEYFRRLHALGAHFTSWHVRAHFGLLQVALLRRHPGAALRQVTLLAFGLLTAIIAPFLTDLDSSQALPDDLRQASAGQELRRWPLPGGLRRAVVFARSLAMRGGNSA